MYHKSVKPAEFEYCALTTLCISPAGLTKMISKLSKEGAFRKGLEVFHALPDLGHSL